MLRSLEAAEVFVGVWGERDVFHDPDGRFDRALQTRRVRAADMLDPAAVVAFLLGPRGSLADTERNTRMGGLLEIRDGRAVRAWAQRSLSDVPGPPSAWRPVLLCCCAAAALARR